MNCVNTCLTITCTEDRKRGHSPQAFLLRVATHVAYCRSPFQDLSSDARLTVTDSLPLCVFEHHTSALWRTECTGHACVNSMANLPGLCSMVNNGQGTAVGWHGQSYTHSLPAFRCSIIRDSAALRPLHFLFLSSFLFTLKKTFLATMCHHRFKPL